MSQNTHNPEAESVPTLPNRKAIRAMQRAAKTPEQKQLVDQVAFAARTKSSADLPLPALYAIVVDTGDSLAWAYRSIPINPEEFDLPAGQEAVFSAILVDEFPDHVDALKVNAENIARQTGATVHVMQIAPIRKLLATCKPEAVIAEFRA